MPFLILGYRFDLKNVLGEAVKQTSRPLIQSTEGINWYGGQDLYTCNHRWIFFI